MLLNSINKYYILLAKAHKMCLFLKMSNRVVWGKWNYCCKIMD